MSLCRLCQHERASVKAHVIPRSFFVEHIDEGEIAKLVATPKGSHPKKSPVGVYDPEILCGRCEAKFSPYDDYGYRFFHQTLSQSQLAELTGIPQATLSAIENGRVNLGVERAKVLARALKCHPAALVFPGWEVPLGSAA